MNSSPTVETSQPEVGANLPPASRELIGLLKSPPFQEGFINTQTGPQQEAKSALIARMQEKIKSRVNNEFESRALALIQKSSLEIANIDQAKTLGKTWGEALRQVKSEIVREEVQPNGGVKKIVAWQEVNSLVQAEEEGNPQYLLNLAEANDTITQAAANQKEFLAKLIADAEARADDPALLSALEIWGRSPNASGDIGIDGGGYNAGIIHFFEYRANNEKNGRYKNDPTPISIDGFIDYSIRMGQLLDDIDPATNPNIETSALLKDNNGQVRVFLLTKKGEKAVAFRKTGQEGRPRIITIIPGQDARSISRAVQEERDGKTKGRLNKLNENVQELPVGDYAGLVTARETQRAS